jgi:8-oxo-dGTP diphosphatase
MVARTRTGAICVTDEDFTGAKAAILIGGRILTLHRDDVPHIEWPGLWDLPGGGREGDETPEETVLREIQEEVSLVIAPSRLGWRRLFPSATRPGAFSWFFVIHLSPDVEADIVLGDEGQGWALVTVDAFLAQKDAIPFMQDRVRVWLAEGGRAEMPA